MTPVAYEFCIAGLVQGQGVRPGIARLAKEHGWSGTVRNTTDGVLLVVSTDKASREDLLTLLRSAHPALSEAEITASESHTDVSPGFQILDSMGDSAHGAAMPRDVAVCAECLQESRSPDRNRYRYGLISCARCGPRFSAIESLPFDRMRTTLSRFDLCNDCRREYEQPTDRRYHAQTIGCPQCGPHVWVVDRQRRLLADNDAACTLVSQQLLHGSIVALRGVGGYQLLVDATNQEAVSELRRRKQRPSKPFAVLCRTLMEAESLGRLDDATRRSLTSAANPIVIVPKRPGAQLSAAVAPHLNDVGLLLPTTAIHVRLLELTQRPLVCTSGNRDGDPLAVSIDDAHDALQAIADFWLHHDRPIAHPIDDSVVRSMNGRVTTIRCARGLAPLPLRLPPAQSIIALGGHQKAALAWSNGAQTALGPHVGDLTDAATRTRWCQSLRAIRQLYDITQPQWAVDGHSDEITTRLCGISSADTVTVWHHHAHIAAGMLEHGWCDRPVLGIAADGLGFGPDGGLWGGEALWATTTGFRRIASVRRFALPGGEAAVLGVRRVAVSLLHQLPEVTPTQASAWTGLTLERGQLLQQAVRATITPWTSSLGRLFDGVACLTLGLQYAAYIGEPATRLEAACDDNCAGQYSWTIRTETEPWELDWRPALRELLYDLHRDVSRGTIAERFHRGVASWMLELHRRFPDLPFVLGGGVFQNRRLCELLIANWPASAQPLGLPGVIPPNDGGLAAGQLVIATATLAAGITNWNARQSTVPRPLHSF